MTRREKRVITAFLNCIKNGEYSEDYAITLIEDTERYGYLTNTAKEYFYEQLDILFPPIVEEEFPTETEMGTEAETVM